MSSPEGVGSSPIEASRPFNIDDLDPNAMGMRRFTLYGPDGNCVGQVWGCDEQDFDDSLRRGFYIEPSAAANS